MVPFSHLFAVSNGDLRMELAAAVGVTYVYSNIPPSPPLKLDSDRGNR